MIDPSNRINNIIQYIQHRIIHTRKEKSFNKFVRNIHPLNSFTEIYFQIQVKKVIREKIFQRTRSTDKMDKVVQQDNKK
jgi:uncharacterized membrane protein YGL010W